MLEAVIARLKDEVPALGKRVRGSADLVVLLKSGAKPPTGASAYVLPLGTRGQKPDVMSGAYRQPVLRHISVALFVSSLDRLGERGLDEAETLIEEIVAAMIGWEPGEDAVGVFYLTAAELIHFVDGIQVYEIQFAIEDQLRGTA
ncbi:hypothetical protein [Maritimibacter alkaliphilus]|uniref:phage tail terminator protein n=1 Tax=Maritimibacter alkaliphilus TaxID=404236 RepID=UPI001C977B86|nr:hypothetical protein [Maritimibacter alkaliphilus]MBY6091073.1 hypothetical protein [Maritimibacter alkaliphilus]